MLQNTLTKGEIFVINTDAATRETLSFVLQQEGYDVICFAEGDFLLLSARARMPVCVFLEIAIPWKSGLDILRKLRAEDGCVPIIAISGQADNPTAVDAIAPSVSSFDSMPERAPST